MNRRTALLSSSVSLALLALAVPAGDAAAQTMKSVAGTYSIVKVAADYGENPRGTMILTADGHYSIFVARATLPKFASGSRVKGTADEMKAVTLGSIAHIGKYSIDDGGKAITFRIATSTFPNWDGTTQKRPMKISGDTMTYTVATPSAGGAPGEVVWKRVK